MAAKVTTKLRVEEPDWDAVWRVERDICYLYHELSYRAGIDGDLSFGSFYSEPYWQFIDVHLPQMPDEEHIFLRDGCLVMTLAMARDVIDGSGSYLIQEFDLYRQAVSQVIPGDRNTARLITTINLALDRIENGTGSIKKIKEMSVWVNQVYVCGYFQSVASRLSDAHNQ
jgi:hypothetical protein